MGSQATPGADGGTGTGSNSGTGGTGGSNGAGAAGTGAPAAGAGAGGGGFDVSQLHPVLMSMSPTQITELFETMAGAVQARGTPQPAAVVPEPTPAPKAPTPDEFRALLDPSADTYNPMEAFDRYARATYGPMMGDINNRAIRGTLSSFEKEFPDFGDYKTEIMQEMSKLPPMEVNESRVLSSYFMLKGIRSTQKERTEAARRAGVTTSAPSPAAGAQVAIVLDSLETEVARKMFPNAADPIKTYTDMARKVDEGSMQMKVPMGGGKRE